MPVRRSIPTRYHNILFRSKLEADWARALDRIGVPWEYEREGRYYGETFYLPDFWLPQSSQHLEVKARWTDGDIGKALALLAHAEPRPHCRIPGSVDVPLIACHPDGRMWGWGRRVARDGTWLRNTAGAVMAFDRLELDLAQCSTCDGWWFFHPDAQWPCQCCGTAGGIGHFAGILHSPLPWAA